MAFYLISAESLDVLADELGGNLFSGIGQVLEMPRIVIQSAGMERWLSLKIADKLGITAGVEFYFLNGFFEEVIASEYARDRDEDISLINTVELKWVVFSVLSDIRDEAVFRPINNYIQDDMLKRLQLSEKLAELYDKYSLYRSDWLTAWAECGAEGYEGEYRDGVWLAELWKRVKLRLSAGSVDELAVKCIDWLDSAGRFSSSPVHLFGVSSMPPLYLQVLSKAAEYMDVYFYYLEVSHEYWGLVRSEKELLRRVGSNYEEGNSLLATFGNRNRDFLNLLISHTANAGVIEKENVVNGDVAEITSQAVPLLRRLQAGIRFMAQPEKKSVVALDDRSVEFHSCCGRMRQVQVLYNRLLELFDSEGGVKPKDILVLTPDIKDFVPYIRAVFGCVGRDSGRYIPFTISDRAMVDDNKICKSLLKLLKLFSGRFKVSEMWAVFTDPVFVLNNGLSGEEIEDVRCWLNQLQVHWGIDASQKERISGVYASESTWQEAEERLMLGYAAGAAENVFAGEGGVGLLGIDVSASITALECWVEFLEKIFGFYRRFSRITKAGEWVGFVRSILGEFYYGCEGECQDILLALEELEGYLSGAGVEDDEIEFEVFISELTSLLNTRTSGTGFIMGGVTFCQFQPMRNIPSKVICMLGMDEGSFPRIVKPLTFDIASRERRLCDPSIKLDDQGVFLETMLSVSEYMMVFYSGKGLKKGEELSAAAPIEILREYIARYYLDAEGGEKVLEQLTVEHPLQSFSAEYFCGENTGKLMNYSRSDYQLASELRNTGEMDCLEYPVIEGIVIDDSYLAQPEVSLVELIRCYQMPCRYYMQKYCNVYYEYLDDALPENTDRLETDKGYMLHNIMDEVLEERLSGKPEGEIFDFVLAKRVLPAGRYAEDAFSRIYSGTQELCERIGGIGATGNGEMNGVLGIEFAAGAGSGMNKTELVYGLEPLSSCDGVLLNYDYYFSRGVSWRKLAELWLKHLVLSAVLDDGLTFQSHLYNSNGCIEFGYERFEADLARDLLARYIRGYYVCGHKPLPVFKGASIEYAKQRTSQKKPKSGEEALVSALLKYRGSGYGDDYPDAADIYNKMCYGRELGLSEVNTEEFAHWAEELIIPIYEYDCSGEMEG